VPKVTLSGNIQAGPVEGSDTARIPSGTISDPLAFSSGEELTYGVSTGLMVRILTGASLATLYGVGATDSVTKAKLLYVKTNAVVTLRLTFQDASTASVPVAGVLLYEANPSNPVTSIAVTGTATIQYAAFGDQ